MTRRSSKPPQATAPDRHVRPKWPQNPEMQVAKCTGGWGRERLSRGIMNCATCGFHPSQFRDHCGLYQECDGCHNPDDPCGVEQAMRRELADEVMRGMPAAERRLEGRPLWEAMLERFKGQPGEDVAALFELVTGSKPPGEAP